MKQITGVAALALGLSVLTVPAADAEPAQASDDVSSVASASPDELRRNRCATRREFRRVKVGGKRRHRSSVRKVRRIMDFKGRRTDLVHSGGQRWATRKYRHCRAKRPFRADDFVYVKYRNNRAYAKDGKP